MVQIITEKDAAALVKKGSTIMVSGFLGVGAPDKILEAIIASGVDNLTLIANDTSIKGKPLARLVELKRVKKVMTSHIGTNPASGALMMSGEMEVELIPLGTMVERIRAGGFGLGGILTPTGVGTLVENGKTKMTVNGKEYLLELPLRADISFVKAWKADKSGNLVFRKAARNNNPVMATASDIVIAEAEEIVESGEIDPDSVMCPGIFVNYLVQG